MLLCVGLSLLLHIAVAVLLVLLPQQKKEPWQKKQPQATRALRVVRASARKTPADSPQEEKPAEQLPFAKTSADTPQRRPGQPEYEGRRDTRAASETADRRSEAHAPSMHGEAKEEIVTFDQERQEGDLEHEGKKEPSPPQPRLCRWR